MSGWWPQDVVRVLRDGEVYVMRPDQMEPGDQIVDQAPATPARSATAAPSTAAELGRLTLNQLAALAADRGIAVPPGSRKADLVALLSGPAADDDEDDDRE